MEHEEAIALIRPGVPRPGGSWADLGAGSGTFSRALAALLGPEGRVVAVDRRSRPIPPVAGGAPIVTRRADLTEPLGLEPLDGVVIANALHFVRRQERALRRVAAQLAPGGTLLLVEYDVTRSAPWTPFPLPLERFERLAVAAGLHDPREIGRRRSRYGPRDLYAARADRP